MTGKQAVLLIHGIGEQRPMDTLRGFVRTVWASDTAVQHEHARPGVFSKPDNVSDSYELRRLTTTSDRNDVRTDFFEFYWAHMMEGTSISHVVTWVRRLLLRWPWNVPPRLKAAWWLIVLVLIMAAMFGLQTVLPESLQFIKLPKWVAGFIGVLSSLLLVPIINSFVGDAARYLDPAPSNIKRRQEIRAAGVKILNKLHDCGQYDRIVVVGHSLGTVIGYDILTYAWPAYTRWGLPKSPIAPLASLDNIETAVAGQALGNYRTQQQQLLKELRANGCKWLVSDFVTLGSPLTHAEVLLARNATDLKSKTMERELPTCPPVLEDNKFSFPKEHKGRTLHHAAIFGPTRWTNLYFPARYVVRGDLIGGPLAESFGPGIRDLAVTTGLRGGVLSHTLYWTMEKDNAPGAHIGELRKAIDLLNSTP